MERIIIKYFNKNLPKLGNIEGDKSDWIDLYAAETVELKTGESTLIRLGVGMILPPGFEAHIVPRSSTYKKFGIIQTNHMGVVDNAYCGDEDEWRMPVLAMRDTVIHEGDRICQFRIMRKQPELFFEETEHLASENRGGFGSTGYN